MRWWYDGDGKFVVWIILIHFTIPKQHCNRISIEPKLPIIKRVSGRNKDLLCSIHVDRYAKRKTIDYRISNSCISSSKSN